MKPRLDGMKRTYSDTYWNYLFLFLITINNFQWRSTFIA